VHVHCQKPADSVLPEWDITAMPFRQRLFGDGLFGDESFDKKL